MSDWERTLQVSLPDDDDGFLQRSCPHCDLLFAVHSEDWRAARLVNLRCPRCQFVEPFDGYTTRDQEAFAKAHAEDAAHQMAEEAMGERARDLFAGLSSLKHVKVSGTVGRVLLPGTPVPSAIARATMVAKQCSGCGLRFKTTVVEADACPVCR